MPPRIRKKPSDVRSPVQNSRSRASMSLVSKMSAVGIRARHDQRWNAHHIGRQPGRHQLLNRLGGRHQDFSTQMSALLRRRKLVFEVNAGRARFNHALHQLKRVQGSAESSFRIGNQRRKPGFSGSHFSFRMMHLVRALQRVINPPAEIRNAVRGIQTLIGIHRARIIRVGSDLPSTDVDRLQPGLHLLHRLVA